MLLTVSPEVPAASAEASAAGTYRVSNYLRIMNSGLVETLL